MVSKASEDFPEPLSPVMTVKLFRGISTEMFFKLCWRAPRTVMLLIAMGPDLPKLRSPRCALSVPEGERTALLTYLNGQQEFGSIAAQTKNKTFAPRRHRGTEKNKNKWVLFGPLIPGGIQKPRTWIFRTSLSSRNSRTRKFCLSRHSASDPGFDTYTNFGSVTSKNEQGAISPRGTRNAIGTGAG